MPLGDEKRERVIARVEAMSHPLRVAIASLLVQNAAKSAAEVAEELGEPVERIRYQLRQLTNAGLVQVGKTRKRRGVVEQFYVGNDDSMVFYPEELELVPAEKKRKLAVTFLRVSFREALSALSAGSMYDRDETVTTRTPLRLDEQGWTELARIHRDAFDQIQKLRAEYEKRFTGEDESLICATSILLCFENPPSSH